MAKATSAGTKTLLLLTNEEADAVAEALRYLLTFDSIGLLHGIPEDLRYYFDYGKCYRDGCLGGDIYPLTTSDGMVHVFHS